MINNYERGEKGNMNLLFKNLQKEVELTFALAHLRGGYPKFILDEVVGNTRRIVINISNNKNDLFKSETWILQSSLVQIDGISSASRESPLIIFLQQEDSVQRFVLKD